MKNKAFLIKMGQKIRVARKLKNMPINKMADLTKINMANLSFLERGMRNCHVLSLKSIADVFGMDV